MLQSAADDDDGGFTREKHQTDGIQEGYVSATRGINETNRKENGIIIPLDRVSIIITAALLPPQHNPTVVSQQ